MIQPGNLATRGQSTSIGMAAAGIMEAAGNGPLKGFPTAVRQAIATGAAGLPQAEPSAVHTPASHRCSNDSSVVTVLVSAASSNASSFVDCEPGLANAPRNQPPPTSEPFAASLPAQNAEAVALSGLTGPSLYEFAAPSPNASPPEANLVLVISVTASARPVTPIAADTISAVFSRTGHNEDVTGRGGKTEELQQDHLVDLIVPTKDMPARRVVPIRPGMLAPTTAGETIPESDATPCEDEADLAVFLDTVAITPTGPGIGAAFLPKVAADAHATLSIPTSATHVAPLPRADVAQPISSRSHLPEQLMAPDHVAVQPSFDLALDHGDMSGHKPSEVPATPTGFSFDTAAALPTTLPQHAAAGTSSTAPLELLGIDMPSGELAAAPVIASNRYTGGRVQASSLPRVSTTDPAGPLAEPGPAIGLLPDTSPPSSVGMAVTDAIAAPSSRRQPGEAAGQDSTRQSTNDYAIIPLGWLKGARVEQAAKEPTPGLPPNGPADPASSNQTLVTPVSTLPASNSSALLQAGSDATAFRASAPSIGPSLPMVDPADAGSYAPLTQLATEPARLSHDIGLAIARQIAANGNALHVRLDPAELGRIDVRMAFDDKGMLRAIVGADNALSLDLLRRDSADLGRAMNDAGILADSQSFRFESGSDQGQQRSAPHRRATAESDHLPPPTLDPTRFRPLHWRGQLDVMA